EDGRKGALPCCGDVQHDQDGCREPLGQAGDQRAQGLDPARGRADDDNVAVLDVLALGVAVIAVHPPPSWTVYLLCHCSGMPQALPWTGIRLTRWRGLQHPSDAWRNSVARSIHRRRRRGELLTRPVDVEDAV